MPSVIRAAAACDAEAMAEIYAPVVADSAISFETKPPGPAEMARRIKETLRRLPWLSCLHCGQLVGYAYASRHRERQAYQWSVEVSVYVHPETRRSGVGRGLYTSLLEVLSLQGFHNVYGGITLPNPASVALHEALGFRPVGVYRDVGYKLGAWHDVGWWHRSLGTLGKDPSPPRPFSAVCKSPAGRRAITAGQALVRLHR